MSLEKDASESKTKPPVTSPMQATVALGFLKSPKTDETLSHQIRTPLHAITASIESLEETFPVVFVTAIDQKDKLASQLEEITEKLASMRQGVDALKKLASAVAPGDQPKETTSLARERQIKALRADNVQEALSFLDVHMQSLEEVRTKLLATATKEVTKESLAIQLELLAKSMRNALSAAHLATSTLIETANTLTSSPEKKKTGGTSPSSPNNQSLSSSKRALVVDDNMVNQKTLAHHLKRLGYGAQIANNGKEAVELAAKERFDIIFMDINMPIMDGFQATAAIRLRDKTIPIICATANPDKEHIEKAYANGMNDCLPKPFGRVDISKMLKEYAGYEGTTPISPTDKEPLQAYVPPPPII